MAWTYDPTQLTDPTDGPRTQVRFLIQDTVSTRPLVQDEEIAWALSTEDNVYTAAALCCEALVARTGGVKSRKVGDLDLGYDVAFYRGLAASLRARGAGNQVPFFGGQTVSGKLAAQNDPDAVPPAFSVGIEDNPGAPQPSPGTPDPLTQVP